MIDPALKTSSFADVLSAFEPAAFVSDGDGRVRAVNRRFCEHVDQEPEALVGCEQPYPWWPDDQRRWFAAQLGHQLESAAERTKFEGELLAGDGRRVAVTGTVSRMFGVAGGTTELLWIHWDRLRIERLVDWTPSPDEDARPAVDLELALRRLFESNIIGIVTGERDRILTANEAFLSMLGYERNELEVGGIDWPAITPSEWLEIDAIAGEQMLRTGSAGPVEKEFLRRDGSRARIRIAGAVVEFEPFRWVSFVEDITEVAQNAERLRVAHEQLNTLLGMAAHDLRSPIMVVESYASMLLEDLRGRM
ncbi:MAG TPA: PAS domain S-box protein, partial [Candidatus Limnocylindrales bacterium]|nr:PAS domain S-box protein [Candidatus Limnocylindrales bacterium]